MLNKVMIIGNLGKDPEVRQSGNGSVANFSVAVTEKFKDRNGQQQEKTEWINCVTWGRLAEIAGQYLRKGSKVFCEGKLSVRKWETKEGGNRVTTEVIVQSLQMLDGKRGEPTQKTFDPDDDLPF